MGLIFSLHGHTPDLKKQIKESTLYLDSVTLSCDVLKRTGCGAKA